MSLTCIDLFSGAGGLSWGFQSAGFQVRAALDAVPAFTRTHSVNFPECVTITAAAEGMAPATLDEVASLRRKVDVLIGGPPCQTFSTIGAPKIRHLRGDEVRSDPRNYLFKTYFDYVEHFRPKIFVMENVPQLKTKYGGMLFDNIVELACSFGYEIHIAVLNAVEFGVPQNRKRLFIVGTERGLTFTFPRPTHAVPSGLPAATVADALSDLPKIYDGCRLGDLPYSAEARSDLQKKLRSANARVGNNVCRVSNERAKRVFAHMRPGDRYMDLPPGVRAILPFREDIFFDRLKRLVPEEPSWTILAHIGMDGYMYIHPWEDRTLSVREAARIQSFPDDFMFTGNMREQYVQVGNAVPPLLASSIGREVAKALN